MVVDTAKQTFGDYMPVVVGPTSQERVELGDQRGCVLAMSLLDPFPGLFQHAADTLSCWFNEQLLSVFAHVLPQEVETLGDVRDDGLFLGELEFALIEEVNKGWFNLLFQDLLARAGHSKIIRKADEVDLVVLGIDGSANGAFHPVEG